MSYVGFPKVLLLVKLTHVFLRCREELQDVNEAEIESNWDQVVDKWAANSTEHS